MWEHYLLDHPPANQPAYQDPDYDKEEAGEDGRLPLADHEHFEDPDFDAVWNASDDEELDSGIIGEKPSEEGFETIGDESMEDMKPDIDIDNENEWEEV
jgi:hypothetical protein